MADPIASAELVPQQIQPATIPSGGENIGIILKNAGINNDDDDRRSSARRSSDRQSSNAQSDGQPADSPSSTTSLMDQNSAPSAQTKAPPSSAPSSTVASKSRRSNKSTERIPKLVVMSVQNGTLVDCSMENKQKTITFKFDISDVNPDDVAKDLVNSFYYIHRPLENIFF